MKGIDNHHRIYTKKRVVVCIARGIRTTARGGTNGAIEPSELKVAGDVTREKAVQEPRQIENTAGPESVEARYGREQGCPEEVRNEEGEAAPSVLWTLWDEAEERGDRDVAALMWEAMYGRGPGR